MATVMTEFVRQMETTAGPSQELFLHTWQALRGVLRVEMKRRSNWQGPPNYLGILGYSSWTAQDGTDALDELVSECFDFVFIRRRKSLQDQARHKVTVDGLIILGVRHFLLYNQRRHDPLGFRVFKVLRESLRHAVEQGHLQVLAGDPRIRNDTWLVLPDTATALEDVPAVDPEELAGRWARDHLESLVDASRDELRRLKQSLSHELAVWLGEEPSRVRFGDLARPLKTQCRQAWAGRFLDTRWGRESEGPASIDEPFTTLAHCVRRQIQDLDEKPKTRAYLRRLWGFLEGFADPLPESGADDLETLPSSRRLADLLDIPRARVPGLLESLGGQLQACRSEVGSPGGPYIAAERARLTPQNQAFARLQTILEKDAAQPLRDTSELTVGDKVPRLGDIVSFEGSMDGVFWLAGEVQSSGRRLTAVDRFPFVGPQDKVLPAFEGSLDPDDGWVVRTDVEMVLPASLPTWSLVDRPEASTVKPTESSSEDGLQRVEDNWMEYADWLERGPRRAAGLLQAQSTRQRRGGRPSAWLALAAVLTVALLGFGLEMERLGRQVDELSSPILGLPYAEILFDPKRRGDQPLDLSPDVTHVQIGLVLRRIPDYPLYRIQLVDSGGESLYQSPDLAGRLSYSLTFPLTTLRREGLRFQLFGIDEGGEAQLLDEQDVKIRWDTAP